MPLKRPNSPTQRASSSSSKSQTPSEIQIPPSKKPRLSAPPSTTGASDALKGLKVHILDAKLDSAAIAEMLALLARCGATACQTADAADVVVTAVTMRKRLERHMDWETAVSGLLPPARDTSAQLIVVHVEDEVCGYAGLAAPLRQGRETRSVRGVRRRGRSATHDDRQLPRIRQQQPLSEPLCAVTR